MTSLLPSELLHFCRAIGIFPVKNIDSERSDRMKFSMHMFAFSLVLVATQACLCTWSLLWDLERFRKGYPMKMQTNTVVAVMSCDIFSLTLAAIVGVLSAGRNCDQLIDLFRDLQRFDDVLSKDRLEKPHIKSWFILSLVGLTSLLLLDFSSRNLMSPVSPIYLSVFTLHYTELAAQLQYISVVDNIRRRFCLINRCVKEEITRHRFKALLKLSVLPTVESTSGGFHTPSTRGIGLHRLSDLHWLLCGAVHKTNATFNWQLLAHVFSLFLHIIIAPYSFFLYVSLYTQGLLKEPRLVQIMLQLLWVLMHSAKLIFLVYPCTATTYEASRTASIICKLFNWEMNPDMKKQLETFVLQLLHHKAEFTVFGLFPLQCPVLTSIAGAVTTYLVILIQFQNADVMDEPATTSA